MVRSAPRTVPIGATTAVALLARRLANDRLRDAQGPGDDGAAHAPRPRRRRSVLRGFAGLTAFFAGRRGWPSGAVGAGFGSGAWAVARSGIAGVLRNGGRLGRV